MKHKLTLIQFSFFFAFIFFYILVLKKISIFSKHYKYWSFALDYNYILYIKAMSFFRQFLFPNKKQDQNKADAKKTKNQNISAQKKKNLSQDYQNLHRNTSTNNDGLLRQQLKNLIQNLDMKIHRTLQTQFFEVLVNHTMNVQQAIRQYVPQNKIQDFSLKVYQIFNKYTPKSQISEKNQNIVQILTDFQIKQTYQQFIQILQNNKQSEFINQQSHLSQKIKRQLLNQMNTLKTTVLKSNTTQKIKELLISLDQFQENQIQQETQLILSGNLQKVLQKLPNKLKNQVQKEIIKMLHGQQNQMKPEETKQIKKQVKLTQVPIQNFVDDQNGKIQRVFICKQENYFQTKQRILNQLMKKQLILKNIVQQDYNLTQKYLKTSQNQFADLLSLSFHFSNSQDQVKFSQMQQNSIQGLQEFNGNLKFIKLKLNFKLSVYYEGFPYLFKIQNFCSIRNFRQILAQKFKVQSSRLEIFRLQSQINQVILSDDEKCSLTTFENILCPDLTISLKFKLQHYGFNKNFNLNSQEFNFFIQDQYACKQLLQSCGISQKQQPGQNFILHLCKFFYSAIKKGFSFMQVIQKFKGPISDNLKNYVWEASQGDQSTLNSKFILFYFLYNCDKKLRINTMRTVSRTMPLPIVFRQFDSINSITTGFRYNQDLKYILKEGITITSLGFQKYKIDKKGKSEFLKNIFFIDDDNYQKRHPICQKCPLLYLRIFGNKQKINLIDIPSGTKQDIIQQILKSTNILIIQTWQKQQDVQQFIEQLRKNEFTGVLFCFLKDQNKKLISYGNLNLQNNQIIQIPSLKNMGQIHKDYEILRNSIYSAIRYYENDMDKRKIFQLYKIELERFYAILDKINIQTIFEMKKIGRFSQSLKNGYRSDCQMQKISSQGLNVGLHPILIELFIQLAKLKQDDIQICCYLFREKLKDLKTQAMKPYDMICVFKKKSQVLANTSSQQSQKQLRKMKEYFEKIKIVPAQLKFSYQQKSISQVKAHLQKLISYFEEQIQPKIFSYQLAWRQFICHFKLKKIRQQNFIDNFQKNLIYIKKIQIKNSIPFEIIDGDLLQISKTFLDCLFNSNLKICVITILGPQSSGKSTLLNFLFGCDFSASEGRCTRGVYGTYFQLNKNQATRCKFDAILLLDTEGIMANTSLKDEEKRKNFDSKLILFCLAVSDIVLINTKGNIDSNTSNLLKLCKQKLDSLANQQKTCPEYFLIQNMNATNNILQHIADINRLKDLFEQNKSKSLTQAYDIIHIDNKKVSLLAKDQQIIKKYAKQQFWKDTLDLLLSMFQALRQKKREYRTMKQVIQQLQKSWVTIQKFPSLFQMKSKEAFKIQGQINHFKKVQFQKISEKKYQFLQKFQKNQIFQEEIQNQYTNLKKYIQQRYSLEIIPFKSKNLQKDSAILIDFQFSKLKSYLQGRWNEIKKDIEQIRMNRTFQTQKREGIQILKKKAQNIRLEMIKNNVNYTQKQLIQAFEKSFQETIKKLQLKIDIKVQIKQELKKITQTYKQALRHYSNSSYGLPQIQIKSIYNKEQIPNQEFKNDLRKILFFGKMKQCKFFIKHIKIPHINILKGGLFDPKLKYLNMKDYFQAKQKKYMVGFYKSDFQKLLNLRKIKKNYFFTQKNKKDIQHELNKCLSNNYQKIKKIIQDNTNYMFLGSGKESLKSQYKKRKLFLSQVINDIKINALFKQKQSSASTRKKNLLDYIIPIDYSDEIIDKNKVIKLSNCSSQQMKMKIWDSVNFKLIQKLVSKQHNIQNLLENIDQQAIRKINFNLKPLNLIYKTLMNYFCKVEIQQQQEDSFLQEQFQKQVIDFQRKKLNQYKNISQIKQIIQKIQIMSQNSSNFLIQMQFDQEQQIPFDFHPLGCFKRKNYQLKKIYINQNLLSRYLSSNAQEVYHALEEANMTDFLTDQLLLNKKIQQFLDQIQNIIKENIKNLNTDRSDVIFLIQNKISEQIKQFNIDLKQVSHELDQNFISYSHLYAIFMTWKLHSENFKKQKLAIVNQYIASQQKQKQLFLNRCSNDQKKQIQAQVEQFKLQYQTKAIYLIKVWKQKLLKEQQKKFKSEYNRAKIQDYVDRQVFNVSTSTQANMLQYIQNPLKILTNQFKKQQNTYFKGIKQAFRLKKNEELNSYVSNIILQTKQILQNLSSVYKIQQQNSGWDDFLTLALQKNIQIQQTQFIKSGSLLAFKYLLDLFLNEQKQSYQNKTRKCKAQVKKQRSTIKRMSELSYNNIEILKNIKNNSKSDLSVKNICIFLQIMGNKFQSIKNIIASELQFSEKDFQIFAQKTKINFCSSVCPCCKRLCGVQHRPDINDPHQCIFGHQIRGFGNICLQNGLASVIRCQQMMQHFKINYNGSIIAWKEYKVKVKQSRNWIYDDCKNHNQEKQQFFTYAWDKIGKIYCQQVLNGEIKYQNFEKGIRQNHNRVHYILAIDESGSMCGQRWDNLMKCLKIIFQKLSERSYSDEDTKLSIIVFQHDARIHQLYVNVDEANNDILMKAGGTNFELPFLEACSIIQHHSTEEQISFVFMTDGEAGYPTQGVKKLKYLQSTSKQKIKYSSIAFQGRSATLDQIAQNMNSTNYNASNFDELLIAYQRSMEIIKDDGK